jgi:hypothetical protein
VRALRETTSQRRAFSQVSQWAFFSFLFFGVACDLEASEAEATAAHPFAGEAAMSGSLPPDLAVDAF